MQIPNPFQYVNIGGAFQGAMLMIAIVLGVYIYFFVLRPRKHESCDIYGLEFNDKTGKIERKCFERLADNLYFNPKDPTFLVILKDTKIYRFEGKPTVPIYSSSILSIPLNPKKLTLQTAFFSTEEFSELSSEELEKLIAKLYSLEEKVQGHIVVSPNTKIAFSFRPVKLIREALDDSVRRASEALIHILQILRRADVYERLVKSLTELQRSKYTWMQYLMYIIIAIGIVIVLMSIFGGGGAHHP